MSARPQQDAETPARGCGGGCGLCGGRGVPEAPAGGPCGGRLAACAALVFIVPLGAAAFGALRAGSDLGRQALGALAGFAAGVLLAQAVLLVWRRRWRTAP